MGGLLWGHMDHCPLCHSPASSSLQLQEAHGLVPLYRPAEAMSQHLWFMAQWLSPYPLRFEAAALGPSSAPALPLDPLGVDANISGRLALSVSQEGQRAQEAWGWSPRLGP